MLIRLFYLLFIQLSLSFSTLLASEDGAVVYREEAAQIVIPPCSLASDSIAVEPLIERNHLYEWIDREHAGAYELLQKVARIWKEEGLDHYLIYGKDMKETSGPFRWQAVPYHAWNWGRGFKRFWNHLQVYGRIAFGETCVSPEEQAEKAAEFRRYTKQFEHPLEKQIKAVDAVAKGSDAFCDPEIIARQSIFDGKTVLVLYNYAPIGPDKQHFLIVPKAHREDFNALLEEEYVEAMQIAGQLVKHYENLGYSHVYLFHKTGEEAGQTVLHWHLHLVFVSDPSDGIVNKMNILKYLVMRTILSKEEVEKRVQDYRKELAPIFSP